MELTSSTRNYKQAGAHQLYSSISQYELFSRSYSAACDGEAGVDIRLNTGGVAYIGIRSVLYDPPFFFWSVLFLGCCFSLAVAYVAAYPAVRLRFFWRSRVETVSRFT